MKKHGVLVIAHGSRDPNWVFYIRQAVGTVESSLPVRIGYLELVPNESIEDGIRELESMGVTTIIVVPLFVTMGSTHLNEIQFALGIIPEPAVETSLKPIPHSCTIKWTSPLEDHWIVKEIISERISTLSELPSKEWLLLIGHGSEEVGFKECWENLLERLCSHFKAKFGFAGSSFATLHPDNIKENSVRLKENYSVITIPVFLSEGYFTRSLIPTKLVGNVYDGRTLLPHPLLTRWIKETVEKALTEMK